MSDLAISDTEPMRPAVSQGSREAPRLTPRQIEAARLYAQGTTLLTVAEQIGVNRRTLGRWLKLAPFRAEVALHVDERRLRLDRSALYTAQAALERLGKIVRDDSVDTSDHVAAAREVFKLVAQGKPTPEGGAQVQVNVLTVGSDVIEAVRERARLRRGEVIDITPVEVEVIETEPVETVETDVHRRSAELFG